MPDWLAGSYPALLFGSLLGMLALGLLGWRWTYGWGSEAMPSSLALIWVPLPYVLTHAEALQGPRLPLDGILLCYAAFAIVYLIPPFGATLWPAATAQAGAYRPASSLARQACAAQRCTSSAKGACKSAALAGESLLSFPRPKPHQTTE